MRDEQKAVSARELITKERQKKHCFLLVFLHCSSGENARVRVEYIYVDV